MNDVTHESQMWLIACFGVLGCVVLIGGFVACLAFKSARIKLPTPVKPADRQPKGGAR